MTSKLSNSPFMVVSTTTNCTTTRDKTVLGKNFFFLIKLNLQQSLYFVRIFCLPVKRFTAVVCFTQLTLYTFKKTNCISRLFLPIPNYNGEVLHKNGASKQTISYEKLSIMLIS